jgi:hypothetical protein
MTVLSTPASDCAAALLSPKLRTRAHRIAVNERTGRGRGERTANFRFGSKADIGLSPVDVRYSPKSGHGRVLAECLLSAVGATRTLMLRTSSNLFTSSIHRTFVARG